MARETELKLETDGAGITALLEHAASLPGLRHKTLLATYFDTPAHGLYHAHASLRIRREGRHLIQTLKCGDGGGAGLFIRGEWDSRVAGMVPAPSAEMPPIAALANGGAGLDPIFEVRVERTTARVVRGAARIELAIDRGEVRAADRSAAIHELELELLEGNPAALFVLARAFDAVAPLRIGVISKAERGYRLIGSAPTAHKADPVRLHRNDPLEQAFTAIAASCLRQYRLNEAMLLQRVRPEAVHQARVALRRLRTAMTLFQPLVGGADCAALNRRLGRLAARLGEVRDLDVLVARSAAGDLRDRLAEARHAAAARLERALTARSPRRLMLDLAEWIALGKWRSDPARTEVRSTPLIDFAGPALDRLRRRVRRHGRHLGKLAPEQRHQLRKDGKKLRYAVDTLGGLYLRGKAGKRRGRFARAVTALQDALGGLNDQAAAATRLAAMGLDQGPEAARLLSGWPTGRLLDQAAEARHDLLGTEPFWR